MKVLAIDPGYDRMGVAVLSLVAGAEVLHYSTCIETDKQTSLSERLRVLGEAFNTVLTTHQPDAVALETLFFNQNITTALSVAHARGTIMYLAKTAGCAIYEYGPQEIKVAVTGYGKSDKAAVIAMVKRLVPTAPVSALDDEYDAIAVGITALAHNR